MGAASLLTLLACSCALWCRAAPALRVLFPSSPQRTSSVDRGFVNLQTGCSWVRGTGTTIPCSSGSGGHPTLILRGGGDADGAGGGAGGAGGDGAGDVGGGAQADAIQGESKEQQKPIVAAGGEDDEGYTVPCAGGWQPGPEENPEYDPEVDGRRFKDDGVVGDGMVDYAKFSMTPPKFAEGVDLNDQFTGQKGEIDYLVRDTYIGRWGWTALHRAATKGDAETLTTMLTMGGDPNAATKNRWTVLHEAAAWGSVPCMELLVKAGANASAVNGGGWTPLHFAASNGQLDAAKYLLGIETVDRCALDNYGDTPFDKAYRQFSLKFPPLPPGMSMDLTREQRRAVYKEACDLLDPHNTSSKEISGERYSVYAPLVPGRRRAYDLDMPDEAVTGYFDSAVESMDYNNTMTGWLKQDDPDFIDDEKARDDSMRSFNATELQNVVDFMRSQDHKAPPMGAGVDGVLDGDVEQYIKRWKDEEWERRVGDFQDRLDNEDEDDMDEEGSFD